MAGTGARAVPWAVLWAEPPPPPSPHLANSGESSEGDGTGASCCLPTSVDCVDHERTSSDTRAKVQASMSMEANRNHLAPLPCESNTKVPNFDGNDTYSRSDKGVDRALQEDTSSDQ